MLLHVEKFSAGFRQNKPSVANTSVLSPATNIIVITALAITAGLKTNLIAEQPLLYSLYFGVLCAKITNRLIIGMFCSSIQLYKVLN